MIQLGTEGLMYTGNEKVWPFREQAVPAPRGHKVPVAGDTGGASMVVDLLVARATELGVATRYETAATGLVGRGGAGGRGDLEALPRGRGRPVAGGGVPGGMRPPVEPERLPDGSCDGRNSGSWSAGRS